MHLCASKCQQLQSWKDMFNFKEALQGYRSRILYPSYHIKMTTQRIQHATKNTIQKELPQSSQPFSRNKLKTYFQNINKHTQSSLHVRVPVDAKWV